MPKHLDRSKTAFLTENIQQEVVSSVNAAEEINQLRQKAETEKVEQETFRQSYQEEIYENFEQIQKQQSISAQVGNGFMYF